MVDANAQKAQTALVAMQKEALSDAWGAKFDLIPKMVGGLIFTGGSLVLGSILPGLGPWVAYTAAGLIAGGGVVLSTRQGAAIERGDVDAIRLQLGDARMLTVFEDHGVDLSGLKRLGPAQTTQGEETATTNTTPTPESVSPTGSAGPDLPVAPCRLDEAAPHLFMVGRTREGKSETLKHLIGSEKRVWYVTSKHTDQVPDHWKAYRVGGPQLPQQMAWLLDQWETSFLAHLEGQDSKREWFVVDEAVGIIKSLNSKGKAGKAQAARLQGFIIEVITAGAAVGAMMGLLSQTGNSGPIGVDLDLLKNFSIVACGKRKKAQMIAAFCKLTDLRFTAEQSATIEALQGYWQLWEDKGPSLSQVPLSSLPVVEVVTCPTPDTEEKGSEPIVTPPPMEPDQKVVDWLQRNPGWHTVPMIKKSVRPLETWDKSKVEALLFSLWEDSRIDASDDKYAMKIETRMTVRDLRDASVPEDGLEPFLYTVMEIRPDLDMILLRDDEGGEAWVSRENVVPDC